MVRSVLVRALLVVVGVAATVVIMRRTPPESAPVESQGGGAPIASGRGFSEGRGRVEGEPQAGLVQRLQRLEAAFVKEAAERRRLAEQLESISTQLAALGSASGVTAPAQVSSNAPVTAAEAGPSTTANAVASDDATSAMERALTAAGLDAFTAADIKRRQDELTMSEMYLRDQATREQWLDTPRFKEEMAAIDAQRTPIRAEIGDDAYDRYLFAMGESNRIRVDDVMQESPAAEAGLQAGDLILRYGEARLFSPRELVDQTRSGTPGEFVRVEIIRNGERLEVEVPRGPLGLRIAATQGRPDAS